MDFAGTEWGDGTRGPSEKSRVHLNTGNWATQKRNAGPLRARQIREDFMSWGDDEMGGPGNGEESRATNPRPQYEEAFGATTLNRYFVVTEINLCVRRNIVYLHWSKSAMRKRAAVNTTPNCTSIKSSVVPLPIGPCGAQQTGNHGDRTSTANPAISLSWLGWARRMECAMMHRTFRGGRT